MTPQTYKRAKEIDQWTEAWKLELLEWAAKETPSAHIGLDIDAAEWSRFWRFHIERHQKKLDELAAELRGL